MKIKIGFFKLIKNEASWGVLKRSAKNEGKVSC